MNVLMIQPGYPSEIPLFMQGLVQAGATVYGVGDQPEEDLPPIAREQLAGYLYLPFLLVDEMSAVDAVRRWAGPVRFDRVEAMWEPGVLLAARLRDALGADGLTLEQTIPFRDKDRMKQVLSAAGIRTPRHAVANDPREAREAAERIGYPLILKPIAGAGSMDTYRADTPRELEEALSRMGHVDVLNVEEFIDGDEFTFDTICIEGRVVYFNICVYRPRPLVFRNTEWITPQTIALRDVHAPELAGGREMGFAVLEALGFRTGFTHMEWYRKADGEVVFGEIAARPPGARTVDTMNYAGDVDLFAGWGEAVVRGTFSQPLERRYNAALVCKRAQGEGRIRHIEGLDRLFERYGEWIATVDLLPIGAPRRDWRQTLLADGWLIVRHPDLQTTLEIADAVGTDLHLYAG